MANLPPLIPLHAGDSLVRGKLEQYKLLSSHDLVESLKPGQPGALKTRPDGTMLDGHHRIRILRTAGSMLIRCPERSYPDTS